MDLTRGLRGDVSRGRDAREWHAQNMGIYAIAAMQARDNRMAGKKDLRKKYCVAG